MSLTVATTIRNALNTHDRSIHDAYFTTRTVRRKNSVVVQVSWVGAPTEAVVAARVWQVLAGDAALNDVTVKYDRTLLWSCGHVHASESDAWEAHEGNDNLTWVCGCGAQNGCFTAQEINADEWNSRKCNDHGESVLLDETRERLAAEGESFESACRAGNYATCHSCRGTGSVLLRRATRASDVRLVKCFDCSAKGVLNLDDLNVL